MRKCYLLFLCICFFSNCHQTRINEEDEINIYLLFPVPYPYGEKITREDLVLEIFYGSEKKLDCNFGKKLSNLFWMPSIFAPKEALPGGNYYIEIFNNDRKLKYSYEVFSKEYIYDISKKKYYKCNIFSNINQLITILNIDIKEEFNNRVNSIAGDAEMTDNESEERRQVQ